jgi:site-specific DNA recombinase
VDRQVRSWEKASDHALNGAPTSIPELYPGRRAAMPNSARFGCCGTHSKPEGSKASRGRAPRVALIGGKPFSRGALYLILQNRLYRGEIVHKGQSHPGEHTPIIDQPMWDTVQEQLAANTAGRHSGTRTHQPSLLAGMLFDAEGNRMTPSHAVKKGTRYRYYVSHRLITKDQTERSDGLRIPAGEIEHLVTGRVRQWLLDSGSIYQATRLSDPSTQRRLIARAAEIGKSWTEFPGTRQRSFLTALIDRIDVGAYRIDIHFRPTRLAALLDVAATPLPSATDDEIQILSIPVRLRRSGREITMRIDGTDPFATAKPDARLIKLLIRAHRHTPGESRVFAPVGMEGTRETDSPLERRRFELSVPPPQLLVGTA